MNSGKGRDELCLATGNSSARAQQPRRFSGANGLVGSAAGGNGVPVYTVANIPDGTSNTVAFAEKTAENGASYPNLWGGPISTASYQGPAFAIAPLATATTLGNGFPQFSPTSTTGTAPPLVQNAVGYHTATLVVCMADGSVRGVSASVSALTWGYAVIPSDGNPLPSDW